MAAQGAGGVALDMSAASEVYRASMDFNPQTMEQSNDRPMGSAYRLRHQPKKSLLSS